MVVAYDARLEGIIPTNLATEETRLRIELVADLL